MLNIDGHRFVDEGADFRNYTYAFIGKEVLKQPSGLAFQIWDSEGVKWLRKEEYAEDVTHLMRADNLEALADKLVERGLKRKDQCLRTINGFNEAVHHYREANPDTEFNPATKDGVSTQSSKMTLPLPKSNWALPIKTPPFTAVAVTSGITFTFGGLAIDPKTAQVISEMTHSPTGWSVRYRRARRRTVLGQLSRW